MDSGRLGWFQTAVVGLMTYGVGVIVGAAQSTPYAQAHPKFVYLGGLLGAFVTSLLGWLAYRAAVHDIVNELRRHDDGVS